jgi:hypothetical protein
MSAAAVGLTPAQRYHLDAFGYVLLEGALTPEEVEQAKAALYRMKADRKLQSGRVHSERRGDHFVRFGNLVEYDPALLRYAVHPNLIPRVEELVGGAVRLEESEAIISCRDPGLTPSMWEGRRTLPLGFHRGAAPTWGTYLEEGHFHCLFVKTLAYLTEIGPDDGGTAVIPGSHKVTWPEAAIVEAAMADERLIHQITAKAGDVLLFPESLIHSTTAIRNHRERVVLISGYAPTMMREWTGHEVSPEFAASLPAGMRSIISGEANWNWRP